MSIASGQSSDLSGAYVTLGLFDQHHHGALGFDAVAPDLSLARDWLAYLARQGVLGVLYTLGAASIETTRQGLAFARRLMQLQAKGELPGAIIHGAHLEGPFVNPQRSGAMNQSCVVAPSIGVYDQISAGYEDIIKLVTLAPELPGALELTKRILRGGAKVQAGHTDATYEQALKGFDAGIDGVTHTFNAIRPIHQREGGLLAAALLDERVTCEAICDGVHVSDELLILLHRLKTARGISLVSDSTPSAGLPDGEYFYANHPVIVRSGRNYTASGGISGSYHQASDGVRHLIGIGIPSYDAFRMASATPLSRHGLRQGIAVGQPSSLVLWNEQLEPIVSVIGDQLLQNVAKE